MIQILVSAKFSRQFQVEGERVVCTSGRGLGALPARGKHVEISGVPEISARLEKTVEESPEGPVGTGR
jgi:hypothetical protein